MFIARSFVFCCCFLLLLTFISFHNPYDNDFESGHRESHLLSSSFAVDAVVTNVNDLQAMFVIRRSFSNFTDSNWYSSDDPCAGWNFILHRVFFYFFFFFFFLKFNLPSSSLVIVWTRLTCSNGSVTTMSVEL
jgi:hypothetical protein